MKTATLPKSASLHYERLLSALPGLYLVLSPQFIILEATEAFLQATLTRKKDITGRHLFEVFPDNLQAPEANAVETLRHSLSHVLSAKVPHSLPVQRYDLLRPAGLGGGFEERYWLFSTSPVRDPEGEVLYLVLQATDVTMQQLAQREMHTNRERLDILAQASQDVIWDWNLLSNDIWWNQGYETVFGYTLSDRSSNFDLWTQSLHPNDFERVIYGIHHVLDQGGKMWADRFRFRRANGTYAEVISRGYALRDENRIVYRMVGSMLDLTDQLQTGLSIEEHSDKVHGLLNVLSTPAWTTDSKGAVTFLNQAWHNQTGMPGEKRNDFPLYFHPEDREQLRQRDLQGREQQPLETDYRLMDQATGKYVWFRVRRVPLQLQNGQPELWLNTSTCINEQKLAEEKLQEKEDLLQQIIALSPQHIAVFKGPDHRCTYISPNYKKLQGNREIQGRTVAEAWPEMAVQGFIAILDSVYASGKPFIGHEFPVVADRYSNGYMQEYFFDFSYQPLTDSQHRTIGIVVTATDVTEQVYAKRTVDDLAEKLHAANQRLEETMQALSLNTWTTDPAGHATYFSQGWFDFSGLGIEELTGHGWLNLVHPDDKEATQAQWQQSLKTGAIFTSESRWLAASGAYAWFLLRAVPIRNQRGKITHWAGSATPVQQQQLPGLEQDGQNWFRFLADSIPQMVWSASPDGTVNFLNHRWYEYTRLPQEETASDSWQAAVHPEEVGLVLARWLHALQTGEEFAMEVRFADGRTGDYNWFLVRGLPVRNEAGQVIKWIGTSTNIQQQKELLEQLLNSKEQFEFLADTIPQLVWTARPDGFTDYFNRRWTEYTGIISEESLGQNKWTDLLHPEDRERAINRWQQALQTGEFYEIEYRFKSGKDGRYRWFLGQAMPMRNEEGDIIKWFGTCTDIEDQKRTEAALVMKNEELGRLNEDLDNFVYTASHDLKMPIVNMGRIFNELQQTAEFHDPEADKLVGLFNRSLQQIYGTINDLAEVVKVQKNLEEIREYVNLAQFTEDVEFSIQELINEKKARITTNFSEVPAIWFSKANLKSVLYNLLTNSLKYAAPDRQPQITLQTTAAGEYTLLTVTDNGLGMDLEQHGDKLFKMFRRIYTHAPGSGLGLYILNRIVTASGGHIQVESQVGQGTTFKIYFKNQAPKQESPAKEPLNHLLLVGDDETTNFLNERLLKRMGVARQITVMPSAAAAAKFLQQNFQDPDKKTALPDLIVVDLKTPMKGDYEFLTGLENLHRDFQQAPPIVMLSAAPGFHDVEKLKQYPGKVRHYTKPLSEKVVQEILQDLNLK